MDALGIDRFGVIGYSCGGPHALACAARLTGRVGAVGLMAGAGPLDRPEAFEGLNAMDRWLAVTSARRPRLAALALRLQAAVTRRAPGLALRSLMREVGDADRRRLAALGRDLMLVFTEPTRQGPDGVIDDYRRWIARWPFALDAIDAPVDVWQGDDDRIIPMRHAEDLVAKLPRATLHRLPGEGHFSIAAQFDAILDSLLAAASTDAARWTASS
jgi:pimeloyl-ACP methyl ester carboxylesterase